MTVEIATYISDLNASLPSGTDGKAEGDNHIRLLKTAIKATFPNINGAVTGTDEELNQLVGLISTITAAAPQSSLDTTNASVTANTTAIAALQSDPSLQGFRLSLSSTLPVPPDDITAAVNLYAQPYRHNRIALHDGTKWTVVSSGAFSIAIPGVANTVYDVFCYSNAGTAALELLAWTNDTTRATALVYQDGVLVKNGAVTRRYLGTIRTTGTAGQTEDSMAKRYVWNYYNRVRREMRVRFGTAGWSYTTNAWRQANGSAANQLDFVIGVQEDSVSVVFRNLVSTSVAAGSSVLVAVGLGFDSTTSPMNSCLGDQLLLDNNQGRIAGTTFPIGASMESQVSAGRHFIAALEIGSGVGGDSDFWGSGAVTGPQPGLQGALLA